MTTQEIKKMTLPELIKYGKSIGVPFKMNKKDEYLQMILDHEEGSDDDSTDAEVNPIAEAYNDLPEHPEVPDAEIVKGKEVRIIPDVLYKEISSDQELVDIVVYAIEIGNGYFTVSDVSDGMAELLPISDADVDPIIVPIEAVVICNIPVKKGKAKKNVEPEPESEDKPEDTPKPEKEIPRKNEEPVNEPDEDSVDDGKYKGVEGVGKNADPKESVKQYNKVNGTKIRVVSVEKKTQGTKTFNIVTLSGEGNTVNLSVTKLNKAVADGTLVTILRDGVKKKATPVGKNDPSLTKDQQAVLDDDKKTKSDKIRSLYKSGLTVAHIGRVLDIHYSFAFCVVDKYRELIDGKKKETAKPDTKKKKETAKDKKDTSSKPSVKKEQTKKDKSGNKSGSRSKK